MSQATEEVIALERAMWERANDPKVMEQTMADDAINLMEPMGVVPKDKAVSMTPEQPWTNLQMQDLVVREITPDCIVLAYHGSAEGPDGKPTRSSVCSTYVRMDGQWKMALCSHQPWKPGKNGHG